jgi:hypothetical protein
MIYVSEMVQSSVAYNKTYLKERQRHFTGPNKTIPTDLQVSEVVVSTQNMWQHNYFLFRHRGRHKLIKTRFTQMIKIVGCFHQFFFGTPSTNSSSLKLT